jgi:hypothetical protein
VSTLSLCWSRPAACASQRGDQVGEGAVVDPTAALGCGNGQADGEVCFSDSGRSEEDDILSPVDESEFIDSGNTHPLTHGTA